MQEYHEQRYYTGRNIYSSLRYVTAREEDGKGKAESRHLVRQSSPVLIWLPTNVGKTRRFALTTITVNEAWIYRAAVNTENKKT